MIYVLRILIVTSLFTWIFQISSAQDQWHAFENKAYYVYSGAGINFNNAGAACRTRNAQLLVITSEQQNEFIRSRLENDIFRRYWLTLQAPTPLCSCLSSTDDECRRCRESWQWQDGTVMSFENWSIRRPQGEGRGCAFMYGGRVGDWDDTSCSNENSGDIMFRYACQYDCDSGQCRDHDCVFSSNGYYCNCPGFTGTHCDSDECETNPCEHEGTCVNEIGTFSCMCQQGYTGFNCQTDLDECEDSPCLNNGTCQNSPGSYICGCISEFVGLSCANDFDECTSNPCQNGGTCSNSYGSYSCSCREGYTGRHCNNYIDYCVSAPCPENGACLNIFGGYVCACYQHDLFYCNQGERKHRKSCNYDTTLTGLHVSLYLFILLSLTFASTTLFLIRK